MTTVISMFSDPHAWEHQTTRRCPGCGSPVRLYLRSDGTGVIAFRDLVPQPNCRHAALIATFAVVGPKADPRHHVEPEPAAPVSAAG